MPTAWWTFIWNNCWKTGKSRAKPHGYASDYLMTHSLVGVEFDFSVPIPVVPYDVLRVGHVHPHDLGLVLLGQQLLLSPVRRNLLLRLGEARLGCAEV